MKKLLIFVTLCAFVRGDSIKCEKGSKDNACWNAQTYQRDKKCWTCDLEAVTVNASQITVHSEQINNEHLLSVNKTHI